MMTLETAIAAMDGEAQSIEPKKILTMVSTDSRELTPGALFFALSGPHFNGHDYLPEVFSKKAVAAVVNKDYALNANDARPLIKVSDTRRALGQLAAHWRTQFTLPCIALTGSCGKTTTRALIVSILKTAGNVCNSPKSFNNEIGVPLTLLQLNKSHQYIVCELGASHIGDIEYLVRLVKPNVALITNAGPAHLEGFGSLNNVAKGKGEIYGGLIADGVGIVNQDDKFAPYWRKLLGRRRILTFGIHAKADVMATDIRLNESAQPHFLLHNQKHSVPISLQVMGEHNVRNALAAAAVGIALNIPLAIIQKGLAACEGEAQRLAAQQGYKGAMIINDSYNANPASVGAGMITLMQRARAQASTPILVLGDMKELGREAQRWHEALGQQAASLGISELYCYGDYTRYTAKIFGKNGFYFTSQDDLIAALKSRLDQNTTVLVKGSLSMDMQRVAVALMVEN